MQLFVVRRARARWQVEAHKRDDFQDRDCAFQFLRLLRRNDARSEEPRRVAEGLRSDQSDPSNAAPDQEEPVQPIQ
jgi:hypothetical protein